MCRPQDFVPGVTLHAPRFTPHPTPKGFHISAQGCDAPPFLRRYPGVNHPVEFATLKAVASCCIMDSPDWLRITGNSKAIVSRLAQPQRGFIYQLRCSVVLRRLLWVIVQQN